MRCAICSNEKNNERLSIKEMMLGFRDRFDYFKCNDCGCIQIEKVPDNLGHYYPASYYSYQSGTTKPSRKLIDYLMFNYYSGYRRTIVGSVLSKKHTSADFHSWFGNMGISNRKTKILDVGCGGGELLKRIYAAGFTNCTGIDPFNEKDVSYSSSFKILKQEIAEHAGKYDLVMLHHSLEHMPFQEQVIQKISSLLAPNGKALIRIPIYSEPLMEKYGMNLVSLDAPRHLFIHSIQSIERLLAKNHFKVNKKVYDAKAFSFTASEQYKMDISMYNDDRSYYLNNKDLFPPEVIKEHQQAIRILNKDEKSDTVCLYITKA